MKIPRKMLFEMVMSGKLQKFDKISKEWVEYPFEPGNEDHIHVKSMHLARLRLILFMMLWKWELSFI